MSEATSNETDLSKCPMCGHKADVKQTTNGVHIKCFQWGCRSVEAKTFEEAKKLWEEPLKWIK